MTQVLQIEALEEFALELRRAARAPTPSRRFALRPTLVATALAVAVTGSAMAGALLIREGEPIAPAPRGDFTADQQPLPGTARLSGVQTADPNGGLPWGLRLYRNANNQQCYVAGRLMNGRVGIIRNNVFHELPLRGPGACAYRLEHYGYSMFTRQSHRPGEEQRTLIFGSMTRRMVSITLDDGRTSRTIRPGPDGAYLAVFDGYPSVIKRVLHFADGTEEVRIPQPMTGSP